MALNLDKFLGKPIIDAIQKGIREYEPEVRKQANIIGEKAGVGAALGVIYIGSMVLFPLPTVAVTATTASILTSNLSAKARKREARLVAEQASKSDDPMKMMEQYGAEHPLFSFGGLKEVFVGGFRSAAQFLTKGPSLRTVTFLAGAVVGGCALASLAPALLPAGAALTIPVGQIATAVGLGGTAAATAGSVTVGAKALGFAVPAVLLAHSARRGLGTRKYIRDLRSALTDHQKKVAKARAAYEASLDPNKPPPPADSDPAANDPGDGKKRARFAQEDAQADKPETPAPAAGQGSSSTLSRLGWPRQ
ncbi:MAG: hypothetical protein Alpg2KO_13090 [Alphaproteobacteria bacterium]